MDARHRGEKMSQMSPSFSLSKKDVGMEMAVANSNHATLGGFRSSVQASSVLDDVELEDIRLHQKDQKQEQEQNQEKHGENAETIKQAWNQQQQPQHQVPGRLYGQRGGRIGKKWRKRLARVHRTTAAASSSLLSTSASATTAASPLQATGAFSFLPWWDPDPQPFQMPTTKLSPFAISTLPEPVTKLFGGTSIYSCVPPAKSSVSANPATTDNASTTTTTATKETPSTEIPKNNTAGCQWVPVNHGDRVAVMIGTSKDFLLFPSFQRLFLRNLSREDFEDRVARVNRIPCPATAIVVSNSAGGGELEEQMRVQGSWIQEGLQRQQQHREQEQRDQREVDVSAMEEGAGGGGQGAGTTTGHPGRSSWMAWMSPRRRQRGGGANTNSATMLTTTTVNALTNVSELGSRPSLPPSGESTTAFVTSSNIASSSSSSRRVTSATGDDRIEDEKGSGLGVNDNSGPNLSNNANLLQSISNDNVDTLAERTSVGLELPPTFQQNNHPLSTATPTTQKVAMESSKETREEEERRWQVLEERFLREDYDSSEYSYASSSDEEDNELPLDYDGPYYSSEESGSSDGDNDYEGIQPTTAAQAQEVEAKQGRMNPIAHDVVVFAENAGSEPNNVNENKNLQSCIDTSPS
ncbi:hypothetical protein BG015_009447 [Linnemannia schmuckeri]|uniref:Uncharacterized protein n=1 Tax=Linnemannia schmuckeri TaxID=64567 RepID=A0A9P5V9Y2_9FUNG|nr:hypothetical protein BG015_009447 [Linnemannia schmuckeri]